VHRTGGAKELELLLNAMDQEGDDVLTESEYIIANLVAMGKVDEKEVELQRQRFCFYNNLVRSLPLFQSDSTKVTPLVPRSPLTLPLSTP
jgi:hypothetical protein